MNARVQYIIAADDKTRSAISSINRNFKEMERGVKGTLKGLNLALGVFAGVQLKQAFQQVLRATAESEQGARSFGKALNEVKDAARDLLVAKSGLPEATKAMQELRDVLQDPGIVAAVDSFTSAIVTGFGNSAIAVAEVLGGVRQIALELGLVEAKGRQEQIDKIDRSVVSKRDEISRLRGGISTSAEDSPFVKEGRARIAVLQKEIAELLRRQQLLIDYNATAAGSAGRFARGSTGLGSGINAAIAAREEAKQNASNARTSTERSIKDVQAEILADLDEDTRREIEQTMGEINRETERGLDELHGRWEKWKEATKGTIGETSVYADQAARNMQDAFAELFKGSSDGVRGFGRAVIATFRDILANKAAKELTELFASFGAGGSREGSGGFFGSLLGGLFGGGSLFGFANGGQFKVGGSGGTDSQLVAFRASPNETVTVTRPDQRMGGPSIVLNYSPQIDARGADIGLTQRLPAILSEQSRRIFDELDRRYGLRPT